MPLNNPQAPQASATEGTYTGDDSVNRAIPHGIGFTPKIVLITENSAFEYWHRIHGNLGRIFYAKTSTGTGGERAVTIPDTTNFYVGNAGNYAQAANANTVVYQWVAIP